MQNLFHSVQLNVNNPHFLIMQGRITKVLNMKPPEVLGLIEEAAGTKMYESKKQAALRTLDRKQVKLEEINRVLEDDIMPALTKLRAEKAAYAEWQAASAGLDRLRRLCVAFRYQEAARLQSDGQAEVQGMAERLQAAERQVADLELQLRERADELAGLQAEKELASGGEVKELTAQADALSKRCACFDAAAHARGTQCIARFGGGKRVLPERLEFPLPQSPRPAPAMPRSLVKETAAWKNKVETLASERAELARLEQSAAELGEAELAARLTSADEAATAADAAAATCASWGCRLRCCAGGRERACPAGLGFGGGVERGPACGSRSRRRDGAGCCWPPGSEHACCFVFRVRGKIWTVGRTTTRSRHSTPRRAGPRPR